MTSPVRSLRTRVRPPSRRRDTTGGADGNERLTAAAGAVLLVLFAAEGVTILAVRAASHTPLRPRDAADRPGLAQGQLQPLDRFARHYAGAPDYRRKGPPVLPLRMLGPFVLATSFAVIGTGVALGYTGRSPGLWLFAQKAAFVLWFGVMTVHVLAYVWRLPRLLASDLRSRAGYRAREVLAGRRARWLLLTASVLTGVLPAVPTFHQAGAWLGTRAAGG